MTKYMKIKLMLWLLPILVLINCQSGVDFASIGINPEHIVDYGLRAKEDKLSAGVKAYAVIRPGSSSAGSYAFSTDLLSIERSLRVLSDLPYSHVFGAAGNAAVSNFKTYIDDLVVTIRSKAEAAASTSNGAIDLLTELGTKSLAPTFATNLSSQVQKLTDKVPQEAKAVADANVKIIENSVKGIYQQAAVLSQSLVQKEAKAKVAIILNALDGLLRKANNDPSLIGGRADRDLAMLELNKAINRFKSAEAEIGKIASLIKVRPNLLAYTAADLLDLKRDYIDKAASAKNFYDEAERARLDLDALVGVWQENIKDGPHAGLENLVRSAFNKVSLLSESVSVEDETDLMRLLRLLMDKSLVATSVDDSFIDALGGAVAMKVAQDLGLSVANVYALNSASLNDAKATFAMDDEAFGLYVSSQAEKIYQLTSKEGEYGNIYVLFVDRMASGLKSADVINKLRQGKSKVVLVTATPGQYNDAANFATSGLDLAAAYHVAKAVFSDVDPSLNANYLAQVQAKIMYAFKNSPLQMSLGAVITAAKDGAARLRGRLSLSEAEYNQAIKDALASLPNRAYNVSMVEQSKVLAADIAVVVSNVKTSPDYYINEARGVGQAAVDADARRLAEETRSNERLRTERNLNDLRTLSNQAKLTIRQLKEAMVPVDFKAEIEDALLKFKDSQSKVENRLKVIVDLVEDEICKQSKNYIKNTIGAKVISGGTPADILELGKFTNLNTYLSKIINNVGNLRSVLDTVNEKPYVAVSCLVEGNAKTKVGNKISSLRSDLGTTKSSLKSVRDLAGSSGEIRQVDKGFLFLDNLSLLDSKLKANIDDFDFDDLTSVNGWWKLDAPNTLNNLASTGGAGGDPYRRLNRRMYALLFSTIVGRIYHPSVPFTGLPAVATELYQGFIDANALVPKMMASINTADLSERLARTLLIKEVANLMGVYQRFIEKIYSLAPDDREAFERNATPNDFLAFYNKLKTLIERADYLADLKDLTKLQHQLCTQIATHILPNEVMTMLNRYPATHPQIFYAASKAYFQAKWAQEESAGGAPAANTITAVYAPSLATFENVDADLEVAIKNSQYQLSKKNSVANGSVLATPGPATLAAAAWANVGGAVPGGHHAQYNAIPPVTALKGIRFETGKVAAVYLNAQSEGVKKLVPIFDDLVRIAGDIQASAKKIYFYLSLTKKN